MKKWKLLSVGASMVAVILLLNFAVTATRVPSETVDSLGVVAESKAAALPARIPALAWTVDDYGADAGVPKVHEATKRQVEYTGYNALTAKADPWLQGFESIEDAASETQDPLFLDSTYPSASQQSFEGGKGGRTQAYTGYNPQTDPYDPWMY